MDDDYYNYLIEHRTVENDLQRARTEALICLKAKAFLDMVERKSRGDLIDDKNIGKHKKDVFRLAVMLAENDIFELPAKIKEDLREFTNAVAYDLPGKAIFKEMGLSNITAEKVYSQIIKSFKLNETE
jgi:hypothetical protein